MSPPVVVAFAIAYTILRDLEKEPLGIGNNGQDVFLRDIWPARDEVTAMMKYAANPQIFRELHADLTKHIELWNSVDAVSGNVYTWPASAYIAEPPFFVGFEMRPKKVEGIVGARALGIFGDSGTTDHISPAGSIKESSPAGRYQLENGVPKSGFQSYGTRRGNHDVMICATFANVRIRNLMLPPKNSDSLTEGGYTLFQPSGEPLSIYYAAMRYRELRIPTIVFAGEEYGTGSSRDWAAKGTQLLGVRAVITKSFERIYRSNLVGMGVFPLQFMDQTLFSHSPSEVMRSSMFSCRSR
jgi:aconitate hydratase